MLKILLKIQVELHLQYGRYFKNNNILKKVEFIPWTNEEKKYIEENAKQSTSKELAKHLKRSENAVRPYLYMNNIDYIKTCKTSLNEKEKKYIKENSKTKILREIAKDLGRSEGVVRKFYEENNLERYRIKTKQKAINKEDENYIALNINKMPITKIAKHLGVSLYMVKKYCKLHNINIEYTNSSYFSKEEKEFIEKNIKSIEIEKIAETINRSKASIKEYCKRHSIKYPNQRGNMTDKEKKYILDNINNKTINQIADDIKRNPSTIRKFCDRNNISYKTKKVK